MNWQDGGCTSQISNLNVSLNSQIGPISHNMCQLSFTWLPHNLTALGVSREHDSAYGGVLGATEGLLRSAAALLA